MCEAGAATVRHWPRSEANAPEPPLRSSVAVLTTVSLLVDRSFHARSPLGSPRPHHRCTLMPPALPSLAHRCTLAVTLVGWLQTAYTWRLVQHDGRFRVKSRKASVKAYGAPNIKKGCLCFHDDGPGFLRVMLLLGPPAVAASAGAAADAAGGSSAAALPLAACAVASALQHCVVGCAAAASAGLSSPRPNSLRRYTQGMF